jgi:hypothetical protein
MPDDPRLTDEQIFRIRDETYDELKKKGIVLGYEHDLAFARGIIAAHDAIRNLAKEE